MITGTRPGALPFASLVGVLAAGPALLAQPVAPEGLREAIEARHRVTLTGAGIGLLPRDDGRGIALIEVRGEAVYLDGDGPVSVQRLTEALGADADALLRLRRLDPAAQRSALGLPALAEDDADAAAVSAPADPPAAADGSAVAADAGAAEAVRTVSDAPGAEAELDASAAVPAGIAPADAAPGGEAGAAETEVETPPAEVGADAAVADADASEAASAVTEAGLSEAASTVAEAALAAAAAGVDGAVAEAGASEAASAVAEAALAVAGAALATQSAPEARRRTVRRNVVRFGGDVHVPADERWSGDVVLFGGDLRVDGEVSGDIAVIGGSADFGPGAVARRDVTIVGGRVTRHPDARFSRDLNEVGFDGLDLGLSGLDGGPWFRWPRPAPLRGSRDLMETFLRFAFLGLLGSVVLLVAAGSARRVADRVTREPLRAGVVGFLAQLLFLPLLLVGSVVLVITLIGIPLLVLVPVVVVAALVVLLLGFTGVVQLVSRLLARGPRSDLALFWVGLVLLMTPALFGDALQMVGGPFRLFAVVLGVTGFVVEYLAWTAGAGAVILNWFGGVPAPAAGGSPPPMPPAPLPPPARAD